MKRNLRSAIDRIPRFERVYYAALLVWIGTTAMHIPDGYLSPASCLVMFLLALPFWARGLRRLRQGSAVQLYPKIALIAAFSFVLMMFNFPLPGGTSGHAVGGALAAIVLGPEVAALAITTTLVLQAVLFGDGGILALGANCFNMAIVLPYMSFAVYRLIAGRTKGDLRLRSIGLALGGWAGLTAAALCAGVEFGLQPILFHSAGGVPLYAPYPLAIAVPAMVIPHALIVGVAEGLVTVLVSAYLQQTRLLELAEFQTDSATEPHRSQPAHRRTLWVALAALAIATPLGLLAPGTAWGEWSSKQIFQRGLGYVPQGLDRLNHFWSAPLSGYQASLAANPILGYLLSAFLGMGLIGLLAWIGLRLYGSEKTSPTKLPAQHRGWNHLPDIFHRRNLSTAIEKTLLGFQHGLAEAWTSESSVDQPGLFQQLDPRLKLLITLLFLITIGSSRSQMVLVSLYLLILGLAWASRIPPARLIRRVWLALPFFTVGLALPALVMTPGPALIHLPAALAITQSGVRSAIFLLLRVGSSLSLTLLLVLTTHWNSLLRALRVFKLPTGLIWTLETTYRYSFTLLEQADEMLLSRKSRVLGYLPDGMERQVLTASAGVLLGKTLSLGSEVSLAMQARGFQGVPRTMDRFKLRRLDWGFGLGILLVLVCAIWLGNGLLV